MTPEPQPFDDIPRTPAGHFALHLYAAVFRVLRHLRQLSSLSDTEVEESLERYPFLATYFEQTQPFLPTELSWDDAPAWWQRQIQAWEEACTVHLPLRALTAEAGLDFDHRTALVLAGLVEEDSRFGTLFADLQKPLTQRRPTLETLGRLLRSRLTLGSADSWGLCRPLLAAGLLHAHDAEAPRSEWVLRVPSTVWDAVRGELGSEPLSGCRYRPIEGLERLSELILPADLEHRIGHLPELLDDESVKSVVVRSHPGAEPVALLAALARTRGRGLLVVDANDESTAPPWQTVGPLATLSGSMPVLIYDLGPGETRSLPRLPGYGGPVGIQLGHEGGLDGDLLEKSVHLELPPPDAGLRARSWRRALGDHAGPELPAIAERFHLDTGFIRRGAELAIVQASLAGHDQVTLEDVRRATRALNRQQLDTLATHLPARGTWGHLVAADSTRTRLFELEQRCRHRERIQGRLGPAFEANANHGVRALFTGPSGTGKTLAARILAAELGKDLYRVDLAAVVNKYIGETEKNLHRVLSRAEALDVVLLLDEGDSLLSGRTEVRSSNDRYANLETNYLLQRLETFRGIVVVTTNLAANIDRAFKRRMEIVVPFQPPAAEERCRILELHLPVGHRVRDRDLERVAVRCELTGGQFRNAAQHAALLALDEGDSPLDFRHLEAGLRSEYQKAGGTFPLKNGHHRSPRHDRGAFAAALTGS